MEVKNDMKHCIHKNKIVLDERRTSIIDGKCSEQGIRCEAASVAGSVSQRACVYCGARVVLNPITDAFHIVHGPIGCASYTWDIRGSLSHGEDIFRNSFSTDLKETDIIFGGIGKLRAAIKEIAEKHNPKLIFVYATCIVGVIGDDVDALCKQMSKGYGIDVIPVKTPGFSGNKSTGYRLACDAIAELVRRHKNDYAKETVPKSINILGEYNLAGEMWIIKKYMERFGIKVISTFTGDSRFAEMIQAPRAALNVVQCAGSSTYLAKLFEEDYGIPYLKVSFFGIKDTIESILNIISMVGDEEMIRQAWKFTDREKQRLKEEVQEYKKRLKGKRAAIFVGGGFKAISLIRQFHELGMKVVLVGTQTGKKEEYKAIQRLVEDDAVVLDDANPAELETFMKEKGADILVGGVKERPLAYKLGIAFCDHNHERKLPLAGFEGVRNFMKEVNASLNHPVWECIK